MNNFIHQLDTTLKSLTQKPDFYNGGCDAVAIGIYRYINHIYPECNIKFLVICRDTYDLENNWVETNYCSHVVVFIDRGYDINNSIEYTFDSSGMDAYFKWDSKWNFSGRLSHIFSWREFNTVNELNIYLYTNNNKDKPYIPEIENEVFNYLTEAR